MGIHGLASFVQNYPSLNVQRTWSLSNAPQNSDHLIFDGNAFVYHYAYLHREHWTHGGQYKYLALVIQHTISALRQAGFTLTFLFDGALPLDKQDTRIKRYKEYVERTVLTMENLSPINASNKNQSTAFLLEGPQYRHDLYVIPPMTLEVCIQTLYELSVPVYVCSGEADGVVAQLAEETGGYIVSKDSDMLVYPRCGKGYIPLDTLVVPLLGNSSSILETTTELCTISAIVYEPQNLAKLLGLDLQMLPLFGTLMGNDYMNVQVIKYPIIAWCSENAKTTVHQQGSSQWPKCVAEFIRLMDQRTAAVGNGSSIISTIVSELEPIIMATNMSKKQEKVNALGRDITISVQRYVFENTSLVSTQSSNSTTLSIHMSPNQCSRHVLDLSATQSFWGGIFLEDLQQESSWCVSSSLRQAMYRLNGMDQINEYIREKRHLANQVTFASNDPSLNDDLNFDQRQSLFLQLHHIDTPIMTDTLRTTIPKPLQPLVICLRYFIQQCISTGNSLADHEVVAILVASMIDLVPAVLPNEFSISDGPPDLTALGSAFITDKVLFTPTAATEPRRNDEQNAELKIPSLKKRSIQLGSQWQHSLLSSHYLSQVLLSTVKDTRGTGQHLQQTGVLATMYNGLVMHTCLQMGRLGASMGRMMLGASTKWMFLFGNLYDLVTSNGGRQVEKVFDYKFSKVTSLMDMEQRRSTISWMKSRILKKIEKQQDRRMINKSTTHTKKSMKMSAADSGVKSNGNAFSVLSSGCYFDE